MKPPKMPNRQGRCGCAILAAAMTLSSAGCMTAIEHPTQALIKNRVEDGDDVEVVMKSGETRKFQVTSVNHEEIRAGYEKPARYEDIEKIYVRRSAENTRSAEDATTVAGKVLLAPFYIVAGIMRVISAGGH